MTAALLMANPDISFALRDVVSNQPAIPNVVVPGMTLPSSGPTTIKGSDEFIVEMAGPKVTHFRNFILQKTFSPTNLVAALFSHNG